MIHKMMKISEFSKITGLSIKALRLYEKSELLIPLRSESNRYHYYSEDQALQAKHISALRLTGFSLREIKILLPFKNNQSEDMKSMLQHQLAKTEASLQTLKQQKLQLKQMIKQIEGNLPLQGENEIFAKKLVCKRISDAIKILTKSEIKEKTRLITQSQYLNTIAMVDDLAREKLLSILSDKAVRLVKEDLDKLDRRNSLFWRP